MNAAQLKRVTPDELALRADVPRRAARRMLRARFPSREVSPNIWALTECELETARRALRPQSAVYGTGFRLERGK